MMQNRLLFRICPNIPWYHPSMNKPPMRRNLPWGPSEPYRPLRRMPVPPIPRPYTRYAKEKKHRGHHMQ